MTEVHGLLWIVGHAIVGSEFITSTTRAQTRALPFRTDTFRGMTLRRTIACFGYDCIAARRAARSPAPPLPPYLSTILSRAQR